MRELGTPDSRSQVPSMAPLSTPITALDLAALL
jgi:hypothetical protein